MSGLVVTGLYAGYGSNPVLNGVDLTVPQHSLSCILGPSGCGKTTLLRAVAGFHEPASGRIELNGVVLDDAPGMHLPAERRRVGYIPQEVALFPHLSVAANIGFGLHRQHRHRKVGELLDMIDLADLARRKPSELSGGQQQRVALARALATGPDLLLLDEPFSALDASLRSRVRSDVMDLLRRTDTTAVLVTHDATEALAFADVIAVLDQGNMLQIGTPQELHSKPATQAVARALGDAALISATAHGSVAVTVFGSVSLMDPVVTDGPTKLLLRPHQLQIKAEIEASAANARVLRSEFRGHEYHIELAVDGLADVIVADSSTAYDVGRRVGVEVVGRLHAMPS
jgi:iron(III) transport system ATP-binding protein